MARYPGATWRPLTENATQGHIDPTQVILHTAVDAPPSNSSLWGYFERTDVVVESTFYIKLGGEIEQYLDTTVRADANYTANVRAISIETEDDGTLQPWTAAQLASIERLGEWIMQVHPKVARRVCPHHDEPGWGYHSMWGAPSPWTPAVGKTCPGGPRILQFKNDIRPWLATGTPQEDTLSAAEVTQIINHINDKGPYLTQADDAAVWVVYKGNGTKRWMQSQTAVQAALADRVFAQPDGSPWPRSRAHLETLETVGPNPPGWG